MADFFANTIGAPWPLAYLLAALIQCGLILGLVATSVLFFIWLERKVSGRIQDRLVADYVTQTIRTEDVEIIRIHRDCACIGVAL